MSTGTAGRTPQTRRKELSVPHQQNSPLGSPKNQNSTVTVNKKTSTSSNSNSRKNSLNGNGNSVGGSTGNTRPSTSSSINRRQNRGRGLSTTSSKDLKPNIKEEKVWNSNREATKFDGLWDVKCVKDGLVRLPTKCLDELVIKDSIDNIYKVEETPVASGIFTTVRKCVHRETGVTYAAKFCSRVRYVMDCSVEILHEIAMLSACTDSNKIVHLKDVFQNKHEIILVLEYAPGGDFQSVLDEDMVPFEEDVQGFLRQILEALDFIHERNIAHLDIKPQNIVLMGQFPNCEIKLCDLEVARVIKEDELIRDIIGTPDYVAPEILGMDPITLAADIWSLGVCAYVLLTGFSPFGGDTDQETLRNITTATLDFPEELFEGVSDLAKEFIALCLSRDPTKRPSVKECLAHVWLAPSEEEPPSPSPLMLKIPTPDLEPVPKISLSHHGHGGSSNHGHGNLNHGHGSGGSGNLSGGHGGHGAHGGHGSSSSRRSCQTCRDKITERKRYLSKSREAIFEKVAQSNLKKSLSKSRERLCDIRLTLSKSRDNLSPGIGGGNGNKGGNELGTGSDVNKVMSRQQDKLYGFKNLSTSQEVISAALGGVPMKRMIGAVSDISHALKPNGIKPGELPSPSMDFIFVPVPQNELLKIHTGSLQVLPYSESGRSTPSSVATLQDNPVSQAEVIVNNANVVVVSTPHQTGSANLVETPLIEVSEEEDSMAGVSDNNSKSNSEKSSSTTTLSSTNSTISTNGSSERVSSANGERASSVPKDIKESRNYEKKKQTKKRNSKLFESNPLEQEILALKAANNSAKEDTKTDSNKQVKETNSVGVQVNLIQAAALVPSSQPESPVPQSPVMGSNPVTPSPSLSRKLAHLAREPEEMNLDRYLLLNQKSNYESKTLPRRKSNNDVTRLMKQSSMEEKPAPLRRGYTHDHMLGRDQKSNPAWIDELNKIRTLKPIRITELIGTFDRRPSAPCEVATPDELALLKQKRRGSLQIHLDPSDIGQLTKAAEDREARKKESLLKLQRRKSVPSSLLSSNLDSLKIEDIDISVINKLNIDEPETETEKKDEPEVSPEMKKSDVTKSREIAEAEKSANALASTQQQRKSELLMRQRDKNWDYFEIDHPKAISDKKLQQLKTKYLRRRTEGSLNSGASASIKEENEDALTSGIPSSDIKPMLSDRSKSVPVSLGHSDRNSIIDIEMEVEEDGVKMRRISTDSGEESADSSRRSSRSSVYRRRSSHLSEFISDQKHKSDSDINADNTTNIEDLEIDSNIAGSENNSAEKKRRRLSVEINGSNVASLNSVSSGGKTEDDAGFISLPHTPTDLGLNLDLKIATSGNSVASSVHSVAGSTHSASTSHLADDGIFTSSEETLTNVMKNATSLDICDISAANSSSESSRPSSSAANVVTTSGNSENSTPSDSIAETRRQSVSPMIRPSSS